MLPPRAVSESIFQLQQRAVLMPLVCTTTRDPAEVHGTDPVSVCGLCCLQKPCVVHDSVLSLTVRDKKVTFAVILIADSQLRKRVIKGFYDDPSPKKVKT